MRAPTVRASLVRLVLACILPTVAAAAIATVYVYEEERRAFESSLVEAGRALTQVVERELSSREAVLQTLATSPLLTQGDLAGFHAYAREVVGTDARVIALADLGGQQLLNTRRSFGEQLPRTVFSPARQRAGPTATLVSDLYFAPIGRQHSFAVEVPVVRDGRVVYYLSMGSFARQMQDLLVAQKLPDGWIGSVIDRQGAVVARTSNLERFEGQRPTMAHLSLAQSRQETVVRVPSLEGRPVLGALSLSPRYGWGFFIAVPENLVTSPIQAALLLAAMAAAVIAGSLLAALRFAHRLERPVRQLAASAAALGRGEQVQPPPAELAEIDQVAQALAQSGAMLRAGREQMEERVRQAVEEAQKAQQAVIRNQRLEAVGQLTGGVAHDFNNLLMVVGTNAHLLQRLRPGLQDDANLARIQRAVDTGTRLTRQLLAFSRRQPLRPQVLDLETALPELMQLVRPTLARGIEPQCDVAPGTPHVLVDPAEFELAIINLVMNARDAMPEGGKLRLRAAPAADAEGMALVEVSDTGTGMAPAVLERVFEPFFTTKEVGRGTGLGLSQVYGMAAQAGGSVRIASRPGAGTTVTLLLPGTAPEQPAPSGAPAAAQPLHANVLLVEDNPELAEVTRELLRQAGCQVHFAADGDAAWRLLPTLAPPPDVVLSDIRMPGTLDGLALAQRLRQERPALRVILMTGYTAELESARRLQLEVLPKPVQPHELIAALRVDGRPAAAAAQAEVAG